MALASLLAEYRGQLRLGDRFSRSPLGYGHGSRGNSTMFQVIRDLQTGRL